jgi:hypothetical protein
MVTAGKPFCSRRQDRTRVQVDVSPLEVEDFPAAHSSVKGTHDHRSHVRSNTSVKQLIALAEREVIQSVGRNGTI